MRRWCIAWLLACQLAVAARAQLPACLDSSANDVHLAGLRSHQINEVYAIRVKNGPTAHRLTAIELFSGGTHAFTSAELWSDDPVGVRPRTWLASTTWWMAEQIGWQGGVLSTPVSLLPDQVFWLVWAPPSSALLSVERVDPLVSQPYRVGIFAPTGPLKSDFVWKFQLWCGAKRPGEFLLLGGPCGGSARQAPRALSEPSVPELGKRFRLTIDHAPRSAPALFGMASSNQPWAGRQLPIQLDAFGAPGCWVHVGVVDTIATATDAVGYACVEFDLPSNANLIGQRWFAQWFVLDASANALGMVTSSGLQITLGN